MVCGAMWLPYQRPIARSRSRRLADQLLIVFAVTFLSTRCVMYPYIVWSALLESINYVNHAHDPCSFQLGGEWPAGVCLWPAIFNHYLLGEFIANVLLEVLMVLQFFWASLLLKVVWKSLQGGHAEDTRSDDEDDDEDSHKKK